MSIAEAEKAICKMKGQTTRVWPRAKCCLLALALVWSIGKEAYTSRIILKNIDLKRSTEKAEYILEADFLEELAYSLHVSENTVYRCKVNRLLWSEDKSLGPQPGEVIVVHQAGWSLVAELSRIRREKGLLKSAGLDRFRGEHSERMEKGGKYILFLTKVELESDKEPGGYELTALNGFAGVDRQEEIERLIALKAKNP
jgi:hypothetical protein